MSKVDLRVDWCSYEAAKYAVEKWHYSERMPAGKVVKIGAWEDGAFVGCVLFAWGTAPHIGDPYALKMTEVCELVRVALTRHGSPVSQIVSRAIELLRRQSPGLRLLVSYADPSHGHNGAIYQAMNWVYVGMPSGTIKWRANGQHNRKFGTSKAKAIAALGPNVVFGYDIAKHKYLYPLDRAMRKQIAPLAKPYPKRESCGQGVEGDASGIQPEGAGSIPAVRFGISTI